LHRLPRLHRLMPLHTIHRLMARMTRRDGGHHARRV
jgi:hypothetical protein